MFALHDVIMGLAFAAAGRLNEQRRVPSRAPLLAPSFSTSEKEGVFMAPYVKRMLRNG